MGVRPRTRRRCPSWRAAARWRERDHRHGLPGYRVVAIGDVHGRLLVRARPPLGVVAAVVDEGFVEAAEARAGVGDDVLEVQRLSTSTMKSEPGSVTVALVSSSVDRSRRPDAGPPARGARRWGHGVLARRRPTGGAAGPSTPRHLPLQPLSRTLACSLSSSTVGHGLLPLDNSDATECMPFPPRQLDRSAAGCVNSYSFCPERRGARQERLQTSPGVAASRRPLTRVSTPSTGPRSRSGVRARMRPARRSRPSPDQSRRR